MRRLVEWCGIGLLLAGCGGTTEPPPPPPVKTLSATLSASGDGQSGSITTKLPLPLRVVVDSAGTNIPGVHVNWLASSGTLTPQAGVTNAEGIATATWALDTVAGELFANATVAGLRDTVTFRATAVTSEPAVSLRKLGSEAQTVGVNADFSLPVGVLVQERYGNLVPGKVSWTIEHGPVTFTDPPTDPINVGDYGSVVSLRPVGTEGVALVRASLTGTPAVADFTVTVGPPQYVVRLGSTAFISVQNSTKNPAVDTVPAGQTVVWLINYDYFQAHRVVSVGTPSFPTPPGLLATRFTFTFTVPGTYRYADFYNQDVQGILVVQ